MDAAVKKALAFRKLLHHPNRRVPTPAIHAGGLELHVLQAQAMALKNPGVQETNPASAITTINALGELAVPQGQLFLLNRRTRNRGKTVYC
jgi:hypothetical protein